MRKRIIAGIICLSMIPSSYADDGHRRGHERQEHREHHSHRGAWIAGAAVVGGLIGYAIADSKSPQERRSNIKAYCEGRVPEKYSHSKRLRKQWVKGCTARVEEEIDLQAERAYNDGYSR